MANHVCLVPEGRAGDDVVVGDSKLDDGDALRRVLSDLLAYEHWCEAFDARQAADAEVLLKALA